MRWVAHVAVHFDARFQLLARQHISLILPRHLFPSMQSYPPSSFPSHPHQVTLTFLGPVDLTLKKQPPPAASRPSTGAASPKQQQQQPAAAPQPDAASSAAAIRVLHAVIRQSLVATGGGCPLALAAAAAVAPAAPTDAAAAPKEARAIAPEAAAVGDAGAAAAAAQQTPSAAFARDTPCVDLDGCVCLYAPQQPDCCAQLGGGAEAWVGFSHSVAHTQAGLALVLDVETRAFVRPGPLPLLAEALLGEGAAGGGGNSGGSGQKGGGGEGEAEGEADREGDRRLMAAVVTGLQVGGCCVCGGRGFLAHLTRRFMGIGGCCGCFWGTFNILARWVGPHQP